MATLAEELEEERKKAEGLKPQAPVMTPELAAQRELARGGAGDPNFKQQGFISQVLETPLQMDKNANEFMGNISQGANNLMGSFMRSATPVEEMGYTPEPFGKTVADTFNITKAGGESFYPQAPASAQATTSPQPSPPTQGITQPAQRPLEATQGQQGALPAATPEATSPQANFLEWQKSGQAMTESQLAEANALAQSMGTTFNPETGYSRQPFLDAQQQGATPSNNLGLTGFKPQYEGQSLSDFMAYRDAPQNATVQTQDAQGRFRRQAAAVEGETPEQNLARTNSILPEQAAYNQASVAREAGIGQRSDFGTAVSDREKRGTGEMSMSEATRMAGGNEDKARQMIERQRQGRDPITGQLDETKGGLTFDQQLNLRKQNFAEGKFDYELNQNAEAAYKEDIKLANNAQTEEAKAESTGRGLTRSVTDMFEVMDRAGGRLDQFMSTGMTGKASSFWKGSEADAQEQDFAFLKSNVALNAMMELKRLSPTGSTGFGALNTEELKTLQNQFAALDPFTDPKLVGKNLTQLKDRFRGVISDAYREHKTEYGEVAAKGVYGNIMSKLGAAGGGSSQQGSSIPNDRNVASAADNLFKSGKY